METVKQIVEKNFIKSAWDGYWESDYELVTLIERVEGLFEIHSYHNDIDKYDTKFLEFVNSIEIDSPEKAKQLVSEIDSFIKNYPDFTRTNI